MIEKTSSPGLPTSPTAERTVRCPACGQAAIYSPANAFRPFCNQLCRTIDLGRWAQEEFRVTAPEQVENSD